MNRTVIRHLLALAVAALGAIDLLSALLSHPPERLVAIRHLVPTDVLDTSRTFTLLAGALLLVTAMGLRRGKRRAFVAAMLLAAISVPVNLLKAFDFEEATVAAAMMFLLGVNADAFRVKSRALTLGAWRSRALWFALGLAVYAIAGCWTLERQYGHGTSVARAISEASYQLFGLGAPTLTVPRQHRVVTWFLDSISVMGFTGLVLLALAALRPAAHHGRHRAERARVAELVRTHGDNSVSWFALAEDSDYFFSHNGRAVIAYRFESDTLLVIGDPLGPPEEIPALLEAFDTHCREHDWQFAFFQARPEYLPHYRRRGWRAIHIGEDPILHTRRFTLDGSAVGELRRMVRKLDRQGLQARMFIPGANPFDPDDDPDGLLDQMRAISAEWLRSKRGGEKGFCMNHFDPRLLPELWVSVAWNPGARRVEAFCTWVPIPARRGWAIDLMRRRSDSLTGATEFLVVKTVEKARERGDALLSLSLSALVRVEDQGSAPEAPEAASGAVAVGVARESDGPARDVVSDGADRDAGGPAAGDPRRPPLALTPVTEDRAREFLMETLAGYYDFKNLFRWKSKFNPEFEDRYLVFAEPLALPRVGRALLRVQSPGGIASYFRRAA